ncbi:MAG: hypothetical protein Q9166_004532 [cf. Caloplaca sp. 2 TL-2023]
MALRPQAFEHSSVELIKIHTTLNDVPWTAARCQRLLRPLSSKIALLRKEIQRAINAGELQQEHNSNLNLKRLERIHDQCLHRRATHAADGADQEWAPSPQPRKKLKRTYSSKSLNSQRPGDSSQLKETEQPSQAPVEIKIPENFLGPKEERDAESEAAGSSQDTDLNQEITKRKPEPHCQLSRKLSQSKRHHIHYEVNLPFQWKLTDGICRGLEEVLRTTGGLNTCQVRGTRSLLATCLRQIPNHIAQEELWYKTEDPENDIDVSSIVYSNLENLSTAHTGGWTPLRQVVRAHGTSMVGSAIREGLIEVDIVRGMIAKCCRLGGYDEAQHILQCLVRMMEPRQKSSKKVIETRSIFTALYEFVRATGRRSFLYRQLSWLLNSGRLPLEWVSRSDMIDTWNSVVQSITQDDDDKGAATELLRLVTHMTYRLCGHGPATLIHGIRLRRQRLTKNANEYIASLGYQTRWPRGLQVAMADGERDVRNEQASTTISSLMTVLCAIGLLRSAGQTSQSSQHYPSNMSALQDIAIDAQHIFHLASDRVFAIQYDRMTVPVLAAGLVQATLCRSRKDFATSVPALFDMLQDLEDGESTVQDSGSFLCAVAGCCARATRDEVFDHTQKTVQHIRQIAESLKPLSSSHEVCNRIGLAAALEYAETTKHPKHLHWALDVEQCVTGAHLEPARRTPAKTPLRGQAQARNGYRWEAGICEWVAKTPAIALSRPPLHGQRAVSTTNLADSPIRIQGNNGGNRVQRSPCASNGPSREPSVSRRMSKRRRMQLDEAAGAPELIESSSEKVYFSHVYIADDGDELSMSGSSQDSRSKPSIGPRETTNLSSGLDQQQRAKDRAWLSDEVPCTYDDAEIHDIALDSEDELSFL